MKSLTDPHDPHLEDERFRLVVEAAPNAMILVDPEGRVVLVNRRAETVFGYEREEFLGLSLETLVPERFRTEHPRLRQSYFEDPRARPMGTGRDLYGVRKDGSELPVEIGLNPLRTAEGTLVLASIIDISERRESAEKLLRSLEEKDLLLKEIHHRVKNNLAVISSLLYLQGESSKDEEVRRVLRECTDRVRSMALVHERLYQSENLASIDFAEYAHSLANEIFAHHCLDPDRIALRLRIQELQLDLEEAIPCGLILTELLTNALKHAFPAGRSGTLEVGVQGHDGRATIFVEDDGVGLPEDFENLTRPSLGLRMIRALVRQLGATLDYERTQTGTRVQLALERDR